MGNQVFELAILLNLKDMASGKLEHAKAELHSFGKEGKAAIQTLDGLKQEFAKGLSLSGLGVAGLMSLRGGIKTAGDFESAMTDMRLAFAELGRDGAIDAAKLGDQLNRLESLSVRLGNDLPGNTQMFAEMLTQLKQGGLAAETILKGAGEAVADLAVITNQLPKDLAKDFAQFGQQFELQGDEYMKAADLFARVAKSRDLSSGQLIEASKYFQLRAGSAVGMKGFEGAESAIQIMAALKRQNLEGSIAGTGSAAFFREVSDSKKLRAINKELKTDLEFFAKGGKGKFLGFDNAFRQMEKLRRLDDGQRMQKMNKLLGDEGAAVGNVMMKMGVAGWKESNAQLANALSLTTLITEKTKDYNEKVDAVLGSWDNLKARTFTPLVGDIKPWLDSANSLVGALEGFAKEHQTIAGVATRIFVVGSASMVAYTGVKSLITAWQIWKIVSAVGSGEAGLLSFLKRFKTETDSVGAGAKGVAGARAQWDALFTTTGSSAQAATTKVGRFSGALSRIPSIVKVSVGLIGVEYAISRIYDVLHEMRELATAQDEMAGSAKTESKTDAMARQAVAELRAAGNNKDADTLEASLRKGDSSAEGRAAQAIRQLSNAGQIFGLGIGGWDLSANAAKRFAPSLGQSDVMAEFLKKIRSGAGASKGLDANDRAILEGNLRAAFPESFKQATEALEQSLKQAEPQVNQTSQAIQELREASKGAAGHLRDLANGGKGGGAAGGGTSLIVPGAASGGHVRRTGLALIHAGETVVPARVAPLSERLGQIQVRPTASQAVNVTVNLTVNIPPGSPAAEDPHEFAKKVTEIITQQVRRQRERR